MCVTAEEQQQIYNWLNEKLRLPVYADAYLGAARLLQERSPGYITFVSHAARDLMNGLARTVAGIGSFQVQYVERLNKLQVKWKDDWRGEGFATSEEENDGHLIPYDVCEMIADLIGDHEEGRRRSSKADDLFFDTFLGFSDKDKIPNMSRWRDAKRFFLANTHLRERAVLEDVHSKVEENFRILEDFLFVAATSEYSRIGTLDAILEEANT